MTRLWLSPGLPAAPADVAAAVAPSDEVLPATPLPPPDSVAVVGSPETELLRTMAGRPADTRLLVVTPPGAVLPADLVSTARPDLVAPASSVPELVALVERLSAGVTAATPVEWWSTPELPVDAGGERRSWSARDAWAAQRAKPHRSQLLAGVAAAVVILGIVLGLTLTGGDSSATASTGTQAANGGGQQGQGGTGGFGGGTGNTRDELEQCLAKKGVEVGNGQIDPSDPAVRTALQSCLSSLGGGQGFGGGAGPGGGGGFGGQQGTTPQSGTTGGETTKTTALLPADSQLGQRAPAAVVETLTA